MQQPTGRPAVDERSDPRGRAAYQLDMQRILQPDDVTCGPTCLLKVYSFFGLDLPLETVVGEIERNEDGGTLAVFLGVSALARGFRARLYPYDLGVFDPTWEGLDPEELSEKVHSRIPHLESSKEIRAARAYLRFIEEGGEIAFDELTPDLIKGIVDRERPVLIGLSATYLYRMMRERHDPVTHELLDDDVAGDPIGHFVVVTGYEQWGRRFVLLDPSAHVPVAPGGRQVVEAWRLTNSILMGNMTYDGVLLEIWKPEEGIGR
jgi:hypothetical protein